MTNSERADFEAAWMKSGREQAPARSMLPNKTYAGDAAEFALMWFVRGMQAARRAPAAAPAAPAEALEKAKKYDHLFPYLCKTCGGFGLVDRRCQDDPLGAEPCPDCNAPAAPVQTPPPVAMLSVGKNGIAFHLHTSHPLYRFEFGNHDLLLASDVRAMLTAEPTTQETPK